MVVDVHASCAAVAELVAGERADDALKVGRRSDFFAQVVAVDVQLTAHLYCNGFDSAEK